MKHLITKTAITILSFSLFITSCNKAPAPDFSTDKKEYMPGETIKFTNTSTAAKSYKWIFPDGQISTEKNPEYTLKADVPAGVYTITLQAKKKDVTNEIQKTISVVAVGQIMFWTDDTTISGSNPIDIKIDGVDKGSITLYYLNGDPACGALGCVTDNMAVGTHSYTASNGLHTWTGGFIILEDVCTKYQLKK